MTIVYKIIFKILHLTKLINYLPDKVYLKMMYKIQLNKNLDLNNPQTFNEKLQWLKLYDRKPEYTKMVDKYEAKKYVADLIGEEYIIPTIGVYDKFDDINFDKLPNQFVVKCTHDSGGVVVCKDKKELDIKQTKKKIEKCLRKNFYYNGREYPYKHIEPKIIIEKYMCSEGEKELQDYKFHCFNGEPKFLSTSKGMDNHDTAKLSFMDMRYKLEKFSRANYELLLNTKKPERFEEMKEISKILSKNIPFVRVDLYEIEGKIYFGELTFYPSSGFIHFKPKEYDKIIGDMLDLPVKNIN